MCCTNQGRLLCLPNEFFKEQWHIIFLVLFLKMCNPLPFYPKYECNIWLHFTLTEAEFNGGKMFVGNITCLGKTHISVANFFIRSSIKANHKSFWYLVHWVSTVRGKRTIFTDWFVWTKVITAVCKNYVVKI